MIYYGTNLKPDGSVITFTGEAYEPGLLPNGCFFPSQLVFPPELSTFGGDWYAAWESRLLLFFTLNSSNLVLRNVEYWTSLLPTEAPFDPMFIDVKFSAEDNYYRFPYESPYTDFLTTNYSAQEVPYTWDWTFAQDRANDLISQMSPYVTNYLVMGQPFPTDITAIQANLMDVQSTYSTPNEAVEAMGLGLPGLALSLGQQWPPANPS